MFTSIHDCLNFEVLLYPGMCMIINCSSPQGRVTYFYVDGHRDI